MEFLSRSTVGSEQSSYTIFKINNPIARNGFGESREEVQHVQHSHEDSPQPSSAWALCITKVATTRAAKCSCILTEHDHASPPGCRGTSGCLVSAAFSSEPWFSSEGNTRYMYANGRSRGHKDRWTSLRDFYVYITSTCKLYFGLENFTGQEIIYQIPLRLVFGVRTYLNRASPNFMLGLYTKYHRPTIKYYIQL